MSDITKCTGGDCPIKQKCYRFIVKPDKYDDYYFDRPPFEIRNSHVICEHFKNIDKMQIG